MLKIRHDAVFFFFNRWKYSNLTVVEPLDMLRKILLISFLCLLSCLSQAQSPLQIVDSLKRELRKKPSDNRKVKIYSDLTWNYSSISTDSALRYGAKALALSKILKDDRIMGQVYSDLGSVFLAKGDMETAKKNYQESLNIRAKIRDYEGIASNWSNIGGIYQRQHVLDTAMIYYLKAVNYYETQRNEKNLDFLKNNIAVLYEDMHNYPKAIAMYKEVADYREHYNFTGQLAMVYNNLGNVYKKVKDYGEAERYFKESMELSRSVGDSLVLGNTYNNLGALYNTMNQSDKAVSVLEQGQKILRKVNSAFDLALIEYSLAKAYANKKEYVKSKNLYLKSIRTMTRLKSNEYIEAMYLNLIPVYANLNMPDSASYYTEKYKAFQDQSIEEKVAQHTTELETKYQTTKKEKLLLEKEAEAHSRNMIIILLVVFAVFVGLIGFLFYRQQQLKNRQLAKENKLKQSLSKIETQNKLQEQRLSISRDLHDNIGAQLTFVVSAVDNIKYGFDIQNPTLNTKLDRISNFTKSTIIELRDTIWAMNADEISFEDLKLRIMNFIEKAKKAEERINFNFEIDDELSHQQLTSLAGMNVYRMIQESVNNAIKYAQADKISVAVKSKKNHIEIAVSDNGVGFSLQDPSSGNGLHNMKKRIKDLGGSIDIDSEVGKGTTVTAIIHKNASVATKS